MLWRLRQSATSVRASVDAKLERHGHASECGEEDGSAAEQEEPEASPALNVILAGPESRLLLRRIDCWVGGSAVHFPERLKVRSDRLGEEERRGGGRGGRRAKVLRLDSRLGRVRARGSE